jgi:hypothetical protein
MAKKNGGAMPPHKTRIDELVAQYVQIRDRMEELKKEYERTIEPFKTVQEQLRMRILAFLDGTGQEMARTNEGTVSKITKHSASLHMPDEFMEFVFKHRLPELLDRKANSTACISYANEHGTLPPGVTINSIRTISVRVA